MKEAGSIPETEKQRVKKWILLIAMLFALAVLIISVIYLAKIKGWIGRREGSSLLTIVNSEMAAPEDLNQTLTFIDDEHMVDARCADELEKLLRDCRGAGFDPVITAAFRSSSEQRELVNELADEYMRQGHDAERAKELALQQIAAPGHSEHQLGLSADIIQADADENGQSGIREWLSAHAWEYGFILRYPQGKETVTGHGYDPRHYRYVGQNAAKQIHELDITLEEYVSMFYSK